MTEELADDQEKEVSIFIPLVYFVNNDVGIAFKGFFLLLMLQEGILWSDR